MTNLIALNLGCGEKIWPFSEGWINVDIEPPPAHIHPDDIQVIKKWPLKKRPTKKFVYLQADIVEDLSMIERGSVDEIHAYHVVEHIHSYDLVPVLSVWRDKLKPTGHLVLEAPDIFKCAINLLTAKTVKDGQLAGQGGIQGLYGLQEKGNTYSDHKWGWSGETITPVLKAAGFPFIREVDARTHWGPKRDFRVEAGMQPFPGQVAPQPKPVGEVDLDKIAMQMEKGEGAVEGAQEQRMNFRVQPQDSVPKDHLLKNISQNLKLMTEYMTSCRVNDKTAVIVSAGPSLKQFIPKLKKLNRKKNVIFCVKHAIPTLVDNGIDPDGIIVLDPRELDGISTHGVKRRNLFDKTPKSSTIFAASVTSPTVIEYLQKRGHRVVGWHALTNEALKFPDQIKETIAVGTCAGIRAIGVVHTLGFRNITLVAYDSCLEKEPTEEEKKMEVDGRPKYLKVFYKNGDKPFWTTGELVAQVQDLEHVFSNPQDINFDVMSGGFVEELWKDVEPLIKRKSFDQYIK